MTVRPISFSGPMVLAILAGRKTQTRIYPPKNTSAIDRDHLMRRLMNGISHINENGCWIWGKALSAGYGSMTVGGKTVRAHRLMLAIARGLDERSLDEVCHHCDTPACVNPEHLFLGTHGDNVRDAVAKGRARPPVGPILTGANNPAAKLSDSQVMEIFDLLESGKTQRSIADQFNISQSQVSNIKLRRRRRDAI